MTKIKSIIIAMLLILVAAPSYGAPKTKARKSTKKVTNTMGRYASTEGMATTNAKVVNLGLPSGTLWADRNVGAESPEAYGGLYRYGNKGKSTGEGCPQENIGGTKLDVATQKMGKNWRMPTREELCELFVECTYTHETINGQKGFLFKGPNGNTLFMPLTGMMYSYGRSQAGEFAMYQSGEICGSDMYQVGFEVVNLTLWEKDDDTFKPGMSSESPGAGNPIRAVYVGK